MQYARRSLNLLIISLLILFSGCKKAASEESKTVIVAISADIERINPLYSFSVNEANINELLFLSLVKHKWDEKTGDLITEPMIAKSWQWAQDSASISIVLRDDLSWSDGKKLTIDDIIFSFDLYSDPEVQSYLYGTFKNFFCNKENHIDLTKSFQKISGNQLKINFIPKSLPSLYCLDFPVVPKHIFDKLTRKEIINAAVNFNPVTSGPFLFDKWDKNQAVIIKKNNNSYLGAEGNVEKIIFKIIPEYTARLTQVKKGEVDLIDDLKAEDVKDLKTSPELNLIPVEGREYDYIGWNNIDPATYEKQKKTTPNILFGSAKVRKALTYAINRPEVLKEFLGEYGSLANSPISSIFKGAVNSSLIPYSFNPDSAKKLLAEEGWIDADKDGILEKGGKKFKFTLSISTNKPRRIFAATLMKNTFKQIGIEFNIEQLEPGVFIDKLNKKGFDAWMAGWFVPIPLDLKISWHSDLEKTPMNFCSYQNKKADLLLEEIEKVNSAGLKNQLFKNLEEILYNEQPVTFLYWIDNIVAYNKRIKNIDVNPLGVVHHCWKWYVN